MYLQIKKIERKDSQCWFDNVIRMIGLYKDDWVFIKWIKHDPIIIQKLLQSKIEITLPEIQSILKESEIEKLIPPTTPWFFANIPLKWFD